MTEKKVFMNSNNMATFVCPKCAKAKLMDVSEYKDIQKAVKVRCKCSCGHSYVVLLERRMFYRKETDLSGRFVNTATGVEGTIRVRNLSRTGLKFEPEDVSALSPGDPLTLEFWLADESRIQKEVVVRTIAENLVGAEFIHPLDLSPLDVA